MPRPWRGCVTVHRGILHLKLPSATTKSGWAERSLALEDTPANRRIAERKLAEIRDQLSAREAATGSAAPVSVRAWSRRWFEDRERAGLTRIEEDRAKLEEHVLSVRGRGWPSTIGELLVEEVRPRHLVEVVERLKAAGAAPRTVRNVYYLARAMFRDAVVAELIPLGANPAVLTKRQLPKVRDSKPGWRKTAIYDRDEVVRLISDEQVPEDRRVWYALESIGMLRTGEAAGLRWSHVDAGRQPLGALSIETSYDDDETKTGDERAVPIHPTLAAVLAGWRLGGWARTFGRPPALEDLVCPVPPTPAGVKGRRKPAGAMRDRHWCWKRLAKDLGLLELRHRRAHDLRRTGISLYQEDGADRAVLAWASHAPPRDVMSLYTTHAWRKLCAEVSKLTIRRGPHGVGMAVGSPGSGAGAGVATPGNHGNGHGEGPDSP